MKNLRDRSCCPANISILQQGRAHNIRLSLTSTCHYAARCSINISIPAEDR